MDGQEKRLQVDYRLTFEEKGQKQFVSSIRLDLFFSRLLVLGEVGSGKSCLLKSIAGIIQPQKCKIVFDGLELCNAKNNIPMHLRKVCYLWQEPNLFPHLNVWQNLFFSPRAEKNPAKKDLLEFFSDVDFAKKPHQISGGEKQKVCLVQALLSQPNLLLLDEPFSSLDEKTKQQCFDFLFLAQKKWDLAIIYVTHSKEEANRLGKRRIFLEKGKVKGIFQ